MGFMTGKRALIVGVATERSIAWGIASQLAAQGAELAFTYLGEGLERRVRPLAESVGAKLLILIVILVIAVWSRKKPAPQVKAWAAVGLLTFVNICIAVFAGAASS